MSRLQLAINVNDLDASIEFFSRVFATEPAKIKAGYANFAIADPPLKLVLFEAPGQGGTINHLGVETETAGEVVAAEQRFRGTGVDTTGVTDTQCCYAEMTTTWITDPDGTGWEWYVKHSDTDQFCNIVAQGDRPACCV